MASVWGIPKNVQPDQPMVNEVQLWCVSFTSCRKTDSAKDGIYVPCTANTVIFSDLAASSVCFWFASALFNSDSYLVFTANSSWIQYHGSLD